MEQTIRHSGRSNMTVLRSSLPLDDNQIREVAPSVFAEEKHESRGERYAFINTQEVLAGLRREGFQPYEVRQTRTRREDKRDFTKHLLRFRHPLLARVGGGDIPEIVLLNSHDGTSSYRLISGWFRMVCSNGLIAGDIQNDVKVRHTGHVVDNVIEGAFRVIDDIKELDHHVEEMKRISLNDEERSIIAEAACDIRWDEHEYRPVEPARLLIPRRFEDRSNDLWTGFNVVQENVVKGGVAGKSSTNRSMHTRGIQSVSENVRVNRALWKMADAFAGLKAGRIDVREFQQSLNVYDEVEA